MYCYVGNVDLLCGVEDIDNTSLENRPKMFDEVARPYLIANEEVFWALPSCGVGGPNAQTIEAEKILSCEPDLIISAYKDVEQADALQEQVGVPVITIRSGSAGIFDEAFCETMTILGILFAREERSETILSFVKQETAEIEQRTATMDGEDKPGVYICGLGNWGTTNYLSTSQSYMPFTVAGVRNVITDLALDGVQTIEKEKFVSLGSDMDIFIIDAAAIKNIIPLYQEDESIFDCCKAWQEGEIYLQMAHNAYYTNYEIELMNTWYIAKTVYPNLFEDINLIDKVNEISKVFLGEELAEEIFAYADSFGGYQKIDTENFFCQN